VHFLSERPATIGAEPGFEPGFEAGGLAPEAEAVIREARRRRRRRWIRGSGAIMLVAAVAATWVVLEHPAGAPRAATSAASRSATAGTCASGLVYGSLPTWARAGFTPPTAAMPYVLGARGDIVAVLWARHNPLITPPPPGRNNKILWVSKLWINGGNLEITAQRLVGGVAVGPVQRRSVAGGPGPSLIDMPTAGCWQFTLHWSGYTDTLDLPYAAG
jgi:hypothetical protein